MESSGSNNNDGCLTIIAFFIVFLPAGWASGDDLWGALIGWWIILALIGFFIYVISTSNNNDSTSSSVQKTVQNYNVENTVTQRENSFTVSAGLLKVLPDKLNKLMMDRYSLKIQLLNNLKESREKLEEEQQNIDKTIKMMKKQQYDIREGKEKLFFISKKRWLVLKQPEIDSLEQEIMNLKEKHRENDDQMRRIGKQINEIKFNVFDESNVEFEELKAAFEKIKRSCKISGSPSLVNSFISTAQRKWDLKYVNYKTIPYDLLLDNYRFYFFPNSIWVFECDARLVGIYKTKALQGTFETKETEVQNNYSSYSKKVGIYNDTKIITKDIPHYTWLHTCIDGSPDMRYSYNPQETYYTKQEYYIECSFDLNICGCKLKYEISSFDNCKMLEEAIENYAKVKENKDVIPALLDLLSRCTNDQDIKLIQEKMEIH